MRLAIFGGTFDPIHEAHLAIARAAAEGFRLDRVLFIPAAHPPHKIGARAPYADRVRMVELACAGIARFEASRLEENTVCSFSIDTIRKVHTRMSPGDELFFIVGADAFADVSDWQSAEEVMRAVEFLVISRPGHAYRIPPGAKLQRVDTMELDISSSAIRASLAAGLKPRGVPGPVLEYIYSHGLYRARVPA